MRKRILLALALISFLPLTTNAGSEVCDFRDVHCSYVMNGNTPKYIKVDYEINGHPQKPFWTCVDDKSSFTIDKWEIDYGYYAAGDNLIFKYTQCDDKDCKRGIDIGYEAFDIKKTYDDYYSTPFTYSIRLQSNFGKACTPRGHMKQSTGDFRIK